MAIKNPQGSIVDIPRGTRDFGPGEAIALNEITSVIEEVYRRFGFSPIVTPALELTTVLNAKSFEADQDKGLYVVEGGDSALRFDLTVPLARYMTMNKDTALPFKRYQIDRVWRKDEPQRMRSREFLQADIDIVGSSSVQSDAECIAASLTAIEALGITDYKLLINSRPILNAILKSFGVKDADISAAVRIIDKLQKIGATGTIEQLSDLVDEDNTAQEIIAFVTDKMTNDEKLSKVAADMPDSKDEAARVRELLITLDKYKLKGEMQVDFSLARGLDYYTGIICETVVEEEGKRLPTIVGGGRYDGLIGVYSKSNIPAVGMSIGISRLFDIMDSGHERRSYAKIFIAQVGQDVSEYAIGVAAKLRSAGIYTDRDVTTRGISKQLEYASSAGIPYVAIIGPKERDAQKVRLREMKGGTEELLDVAEIIEKMKE